MSSDHDFGSKDLITCLRALGFIEQSQVGSRHLKFRSPRPVQKGQRPFIIVLQNKAAYDPHTCKNIIRDIRKLGFTKKEIEKHL